MTILEQLSCSLIGFNTNIMHLSAAKSRASNEGANSGSLTSKEIIVADSSSPNQQKEKTLTPTISAASLKNACTAYITADQISQPLGDEIVEFVKQKLNLIEAFKTVTDMIFKDPIVDGNNSGANNAQAVLAIFKEKEIKDNGINKISKSAEFKIKICEVDVECTLTAEMIKTILPLVDNTKNLSKNKEQASLILIKVLLSSSNVYEVYDNINRAIDAAINAVIGEGHIKTYNVFGFMTRHNIDIKSFIDCILDVEIAKKDNKKDVKEANEKLSNMGNIVYNSIKADKQDYLKGLKPGMQLSTALKYVFTGLVGIAVGIGAKKVYDQSINNQNHNKELIDLSGEMPSSAAAAE